MQKLEIVLLTNNVVLPFQNLCSDYGLDFIELNKLFASKSLAEHGLGFLLNIYGEEDEKNSQKLIKQIIFDTGGTNLTFLHNSDVRGYQLYDTDVVILSHWHYDHFGGLYNILERINKPVSIMCHQYANYERIFNRSADIRTEDLVNKKRNEIKEFLNSSKMLNQLPINIERIQQLDGKLIMHENLKTVYKEKNLKMIVSGEIKRTHKEEVFSNFLINKDGILAIDEILDDKCLIIELEDSIVLINGCCHSGIMNTLDYVKKISSKPISYIIGGFHMVNTNEERRRVTLDYLNDFQKETMMIFPIHCSGERFIESINSKNMKTIKAFNVSVGTIFNFCF